MLENVIKSGKCYGCKLCQSICPHEAISFIEDETGFTYPSIDAQKCTFCGTCEKSCIANSSVERRAGKQEYAAKYNVEDVLQNSSSGGLFSALSDWIIVRKKGTAWGCIYENHAAKIVCARSGEERDQMCGSKYVQSDMGTCYQQIATQLKQGLYVMFSGTPCECAAIKQYMNSCNVNSSRLYIMDFICHGSPSPGLFRQYCEWLEKCYHGRITEYRFRTRLLKGNSNQNAWASFNNGCQYLMPSSLDPFYQAFHNSQTLRESCYQCEFTTTERVSDITVADMNDREYRGQGISHVIVNTDKGEIWLNHISNLLSLKSYSSYGQLQPQMKYPAARPESRGRKGWLNRQSSECCLNVAGTEKRVEKIIILEKAICKLHLFSCFLTLLNLLKKVKI